MIGNCRVQHKSKTKIESAYKNEMVAHVCHFFYGGAFLGIVAIQMAIA